MPPYQALSGLWFSTSSYRMQQTAGHSFIVRIWFEPREIADLPGQWRGVVEYVVTGEQRYFLTFDQMTAFLAEKIFGEDDPQRSLNAGG